MSLRKAFISLIAGLAATGTTVAQDVAKVADKDLALKMRQLAGNVTDFTMMSNDGANCFFEVAQTAKENVKVARFARMVALNESGSLNVGGVASISTGQKSPMMGMAASWKPWLFQTKTGYFKNKKSGNGLKADLRAGGVFSMSEELAGNFYAGVIGEIKNFLLGAGLESTSRALNMGDRLELDMVTHKGWQPKVSMGYILPFGPKEPLNRSHFKPRVNNSQCGRPTPYPKSKKTVYARTDLTKINNKPYVSGSLGVTF